MNKIILPLLSFSVLSLCAETDTKLLPSIRSSSTKMTTFEQCSAFLETLTKGDPRVMENYRNFAASLKLAYENGLLSSDEIEGILKAVEFGAEKHRNQKRKAPPFNDYICHPIGVAHQILQIGGVTDPNILIAALLHDTVEDTNTSFQEIRDRFGEIVEGYVREVTDDKSLLKAERKQAQIDHASEKSFGAAIVKLSDKLYNLNDLMGDSPQDEKGQPWPKERIEQYFTWAKRVIDALPKVNDPLLQEVENTYAKFWNSRST